ncbi:hypothetical protein [Cellulomonas sp. ATA003]|uniref:hypothetical protein n=1 Tax=Cellulomonas sp. ATA003 TaxID=3073064 RepID=UPI002872C959|nr:hypothetical protein [Cellulomonas sp. ATA003]WNB87653.1 hypothetical protein REH70_16875 [Cellulomonas sp. ATA003]
MPAAGAASTAAMPAAGAASTAAMPAAGAASTAAMPVVEGGPTQVVPRGGRPPSVVPASAWAGDAHEHHADERHADERHADEHHADEHRAHHRDAERGGRGGEGAPWGRSAGAYVGDDVAPGSSGAHAWGPPTGAALDAEPEPWVASPPRRRTGSVLALGIATVAAGTLYPGVTLVVLVVTLLVLRTVGVAGEALDRRRERRGGPARGDVARVVGATPWHGLRAAVGLLPSVVVAASAVVVVGGVLWWALQTDRLVVSLGGSEGNGPRAYAAVLGLATLLAVLLVWFGPLGRLTRAGARRALTAVAPGWSGATVLVAAALAVAGVLVVLLLTGQPTTWGPLPGPPDLR